MSLSIKSALSKLAIIVAWSTLSFAQGGSIYRQVVSPDVPTGTGQPVPSAIVRVCPSTATGTPCSPLSPNVYSDPALANPIGNPVATDTNGIYSIFLPTGSYIVQESAPPGAGYSFTYSWLIFVNGTGTVSSVGLSLPGSVFSVTGSPVTTNGTLTGSFITQSANQVFGNCTGSSAVPAFCSLTANMIPGTLNATTFPSITVTGNETVGGTLGVTGATTLSSTLSAGATTLASATVTGNLGAGVLNVTGSSTLSGGGNFTGTFAGSPTLSGIWTFNNTVDFNGTLVLTGVVSSNNSISTTGSITGNLFDATTGYQIGGSYGTSGYCIQSTGTGTAFANVCGIGGTPSISPGTGAGTGPTLTLTAGSTDKVGQVLLTTGSAPATNATVGTITFSSPYATFGACVISPSINAEASGVAATASISQLAFVIGTPALSATTSYAWSYICNGH